jgi:DNA-binding SARP family transcriptional activator
MPEKFEGGVPPQEHKEIPESIKHLGAFAKTFSFVPREKPIISSIFEGARKREESISTELRFESTAPVMEALSLRLQQLYKEAFDEKGEMLNYDRVLDIRGLLLFLMNFYDSAKANGHQVKEENLIALEDALSDLNKFIERDPYNE